VYALPAHHRWCLTGTPIQNTLDDLSSLITFLRVPILEKSSTFRNHITRNTLSGRRDAFKNLQTLLRTICIRRTRESIGLPDPEPQIRYVDFSVLERAAYDSLWDDFRRDVQKAVSGRQAKMASTALRCIHELRLFCNNGPRRNNKSDQTDDERLSILEALGKNKCAKCKSTVLFIDRHDDGQGGVFMPSCDHLVCNGCAPPVSSRSAKCQFCRDHVPTPDLSSTAGPDTGQQPVEPPSKLKDLLADIKSDVGRKW
jgi:SNF2 family DNA or RNA helicase